MTRPDHDLATRTAHQGYPVAVALRLFLGHGASGTSASMASFVDGLRRALHEVGFCYVTGHGARVARNLVGNYITSLEMQGFSVTVCRLTDALAQLWDAPA